MVDEFWTGKQIYIETNEDGFVIGYSSNEISNNDFIMNSEDVPENFLIVRSYIGFQTMK